MDRWNRPLNARVHASPIGTGLVLLLTQLRLSIFTANFGINICFRLDNRLAMAKNVLRIRVTVVRRYGGVCIRVIGRPFLKSSYSGTCLHCVRRNMFASRRIVF